ncbi:hypothetical protein GCM10009609_06750 [Pseudonocardia aurantiaca]|uniref:DUF3224 domain-containing protein n=1 Tax=Pseudonocardia aurantiaca TaxID=75290 RepID=A0ABW4FK50_9PSEU
MTTTAGRFDLTSWDEEVFDDAEGAKLVRVRNTKAFEGGLSGTSAAEILQALAQDGSAAYVGIERVTAAIDRRKGTFVLRHSAVGGADGGGDFRVDVVPGSGTGELAGLRGELAIVRADDGEHTYTLEYELG